MSPVASLSNEQPWCEHRLDGCRPVPLAHYLKALGILRLVGGQKDPMAHGSWRDDAFTLRTVLSAEELEWFFLHEYAPTPIVAPWNGGSGFYPKDNRKALEALAASKTARLESMRATIGIAAQLLEQLGIREKVEKADKPILQEACRATLPDAAVPWLDAAFLLSNDGPKYPPLLGTGGNDGRLDFTNNFMQRLLDLMDANSGAPTKISGSLLRTALFGETTQDLQRKAAIGQFLPGNAGGVNAEAGFDSESLVNPWDFVLMLEGAVAFAAAAVRRMEAEAHEALSYPFTVRHVGIGFGSAAAAEEGPARGEIWLPLWDRPATATEVLAILGEGRATIGRRRARNSLDFARAVAALGVDRGIAQFQRYGFQVRNGLAYFAVPLSRFRVKRQASAGLLDEIDEWLDRVHSRTSGQQRAPGSVARAVRILEESILQLCRQGDRLRLQAVLVALGACERALAQSLKWTQDSYLAPVPSLSAEWLSMADDGTPEFRLAAALASVTGKYPLRKGGEAHIPLRVQMEPVAVRLSRGRLIGSWHPEAGRAVAWGGGGLIESLNAVLERRLLMTVMGGRGTYGDLGRVTAAPGDVGEFIEGRTDDRRIEQLLWGCLLVNWPGVPIHTLASRKGGHRPWPGAFYALLKLCHAGRKVVDREVPLVAGIHRLASRGDGPEAARFALRRLRGCGLNPAVSDIAVAATTARRAAAALLFPISARTVDLFAKSLLRPGEFAAQVGSATPDSTEDPAGLDPAMTDWNEGGTDP